MTKNCKHGIQKYYCKDCGGDGICEHGRSRGWCRDCIGSRTCPHRVDKSNCKRCGGFRAWAKQLARHAKERAKRLELPYQLTLDWIEEGLIAGCPVFNRPFEIQDKVSTNWSATIDKFVPKLGYTKSNSRVISMLANNIKTSTTSSEQVFKVAEWMRSIENGNEEASRSRQHDERSSPEEPILVRHVPVPMS